MTINYTIITDFNNSFNISYHNIKTSESYMTIGETTVITYRNAERHRMSTSRHQSATTPSVIQTTSATWMQPRHPTSTSRQQSSTSPSVTQTSFVYLCIIIEDLFRAIGATVDIGYVETVKTSNVNIKMGEPDIAI